MPPEIVNLHNLTMLSLRHNQLVELPQSMGKLVNLAELNVAGNRLRSLPGGLLDLLRRGKLTNLRVYPNPLLRAFPVPRNLGVAHFGITTEEAEYIIGCCKDSKELHNDREARIFDWMCHIQEEFMSRTSSFAETSLGLSALTAPSRAELGQNLARTFDPIHLGSSAIAYYDLDGSISHNSPSAPSQLDDSVDIVPEMTTVSSPNTSGHEHVPSLFELAGRACGRYLRLPLDGDVFAGEGPKSVTKILSAARHALEDGGEHCSICRRSFLLPRAEWIEYWHCVPDGLNVSMHELYLPFLRRACSWKCAAGRPQVVVASYDAQ